MCRSVASVLVALFLVAAAAYAHGTNSHRVMGTVKVLQEDRLTITTTNGKEAEVRLVADTRYEKDQKPADRSALVAGARVSIQLAEDDETAVKIKIGAGGHAGR